MSFQAEDKEFWKTRSRNHERRDWGDKGNWIQGYWDSRNHPHREYIVKALKKFRPFKNLLEVGCNCGPNLWVIKKSFPAVEVAGIDINKPAIFFGNEHFPKTLFHYGEAENMPFYNKTFDVLLADAVLIYVEPKKIHKVIQEFLRVTKKALVFVEWYDDKSTLGVIKDFHWSRNYAQLLKGYGLRVTKTKITPEMWPNEKWHTHGYIFTSRLR